MVALPRFLGKLKFKSKFDLIAMICLCLDGFIRDDDDYDDDLHSSYKEFILSRYINIYASHVGVTGNNSALMEECVFRFRLDRIIEAAYLLNNQSSYTAWSEFRSGLRRFLTANLRSFNSLPDE